MVLYTHNFIFEGLKFHEQVLLPYNDFRGEIFMNTRPFMKIYTEEY